MSLGDNSIKGCDTLSTTIGKKKVHAKGSAREEKYIDLGEMGYEDESLIQHKGSTIKIAEIYRYEDMKNLTKYLYDGHTIIIDYSSIANDELAMTRITNELKSIADDTNGDVAGIGHNLLLATSNGIRVDRNKIRGSY